MPGGKKKPPGIPPQRKGADLMSQMGFGLPGDINQMYGDLEGDEDLEAELAALTGQVTSPQKTAAKKGPVAVAELDRMVAESLRDYASDEELSDTEDPDLLAELNELTTEEAPTQSPVESNHNFQKSTGENQLSVIQDRMSMYSQAFANAKAAGDSSKQRRLDRGLKTLNELLKKAQKGRPVDENDIPPAVSVGPATPSSLPTPTPEQPSEIHVSPAKRPSETSSSQSTISTSPPKVPAPASVAQSAPSIQRRQAPVPLVQPAPVKAPSPTNVPTPAPRASQVKVNSSSTAVATSATPSLEKAGSSESLPATDGETRKMLITRRDQYRHAAVEAKKNNDMKTATKYVKISKQFDSVIQAVEEGNPVDLSKMPPPPAIVERAPPLAKEIASPTKPRVEQSTHQGSPPAEPEPDYMPPVPTAEEEKQIFHAPDAPKTVEEALQQRLEKYQCVEADAKKAGESGKARRMGRIVKQYQDAIKAHKAGRKVDFDELPTPPGYAPIPVGLSAASSQNVAASGPQPMASQSQQRASQPQPPQKASQPQQGMPQPQQRAPQPQQRAPQPPQAGAVPAAAQVPGARPKEYTEQQINKLASQKKSHSTRSQQQEIFLRERYAEFKEAALNAKKNNDIELAKKYLRLMKGLDPMILACESGLPVDLAQVPPSPNQPNEADKFVIVSPEDCVPTGDRTEVFTKLETELKQQIRTCATNSQHFSKLGDVVSASKFKKLEDNCRKDLDALKNALLHGDPVPKFHYETRSFSVVRTNTELGDGELEFTVIRGIQYHLPNGFSEKDLDTYVKLELPFPNDEPQEKKSDTVKSTINPEYEETFILHMDRKARSFVRVVERKGIKAEIFYKRGFLKSDKLLGTVNVKLMPLESQCTLHDSYDLMDGRKSVGGKLEVKVRVRDPFKTKQVDEVKEKWLVIDQFLRTQASVAQDAKKNMQRQKSEGSTSMEVLRYEKQQLDKQIFALKDSLSLTQTQALKHKSSLLQEKIELQQKKLREGGKETWKAYVVTVREEIPAYEAEAHQYAKLGDMQKAQIFLTKKKMAEKEIISASDSHLHQYYLQKNQ